MKKVVIVIPNTETAESFKEFLESESVSIFIAKNEEEAVSLMKNHQVDTVLLEPLWKKNFLIEDPGSIENIDFGGIGFVFFNKIQKDFPGTRIILLTVICHKNILKTGFPKKLPYLQAPISLEAIATVLG